MTMIILALSQLLLSSCAQDIQQMRCSLKLLFRCLCLFCLEYFPTRVPSFPIFQRGSFTTGYSHDDDDVDDDDDDDALMMIMITVDNQYYKYYERRKQLTENQRIDNSCQAAVALLLRPRCSRCECPSLTTYSSFLCKITFRFQAGSCLGCPAIELPSLS